MSSHYQFYHFAETADTACLLEQIDLQITRAKEEASSRKEILEKVDKWLAARQEECWLEEYNRVKFYSFRSKLFFFLHLLYLC